MSFHNIGKALQESSEDKAGTPTVNPESTVLNVVCMGTKCHHSNKDSQSILTSLFKVIDTSKPDKGVSKQYTHMIDGFGAKPKKSKEELIDENEAKLHPMLGAYDVDCEYDAKEDRVIVTKKKHELGVIEEARRKILQAQIRGKGYKKIVEEIIKVCDALMQTGKAKLPLILNLYGFSRGADTALRVANILLAEYGLEDVRINIFAIDPVPGPNRKGHMKARIIPPNVDNYVSILMKHEPALGFEPMDASRLVPLDPERTRIQHKIYFGNHGAAVTVPSKPEILDSAMLLWDAMHKFAKRNGTRLKKNIPFVRLTPELQESDQYIELDVASRLKFYTHMLVHEKDYAKLQTVLGTDREFLTRREDYLFHGRDYFCDKEHQELFKKMYPAYFDYFFQKNIEGYKVEKVIAEMEGIAQIPELKASLEAKEYPTKKPVPSARGIPLVVRFNTLEDAPIVHDKFSRLLHSIMLLTNLAHRNGDSEMQNWGKQLRAQVLVLLEKPGCEKMLNEILLAAMKLLPKSKAVPKKTAQKNKKVSKKLDPDAFRVHLNFLLDKPEEKVISFANYAIKQLNEVEFEAGAPDEFKKVREEFTKMLKSLDEQGLGNHTGLLKAMLLQGLHTTSKLRYVCKINKEVNLDKELRRLQMVLPVISLPISDKEKLLLKEFEVQLFSIAPVQRFQTVRERAKAMNEDVLVIGELPASEEMQTGKFGARQRAFAVTTFSKSPKSSGGNSTADKKDQTTPKPEGGGS